MGPILRLFKGLGKGRLKDPRQHIVAVAQQQEQSDDEYVLSRFRVGVVCLVVFLFFGFLVGRLFWIQVLHPERLIAEGNNSVLRNSRFETARGLITDRNGKILALSVPVTTVFADAYEMNRRKVTHNPDLMRELASILELDAGELFKTVSNTHLRHIRLKKYLPMKNSIALRKLAIPGISLADTYQRIYPTGEVNAQLVGILDSEGDGVYGIEQSFNTYLSAEAARTQGKRDNKNHIVENVKVIEKGKPGGNLMLSVDDRLQTFAYSALHDVVQEHQAEAASAVMIDVKTGEVMVMVNYPSFNPNDRSVFDPSLARNRSVSDVFEPGSTIKPLIAIAALETGLVSWDESFDTRPYRVPGKSAPIRDEHPMDSGKLADIIRYSSNVGMARISQRIGPEQSLYLLERFGFGTTTNLGLEAESRGQLNADRRFWSEIDKATLGFGYGVSVTAIQLASAYATIANMGARVQVNILRATDAPTYQRVANAEIVRRMHAVLEDVVAQGSGGRAAINRYRIAGKTGTAHILRNGSYVDDYMASFVGFAPISAPRFALAVVVFLPQTGSHFGGRVSGPVFRDIMTRALQLYNIAPDRK